jgi:hypothetical protein
MAGRVAMTATGTRRYRWHRASTQGREAFPPPTWRLRSNQHSDHERIIGTEPDAVRLTLLLVTPGKKIELPALDPVFVGLSNVIESRFFMHLLRNEALIS